MMGSQTFQSRYSGQGVRRARLASMARGPATKSASPGGSPIAFCEAVK